MPRKNRPATTQEKQMRAKHVLWKAKNPSPNNRHGQWSAVSLQSPIPNPQSLVLSPLPFFVVRPLFATPCVAIIYTTFDRTFSFFYAAFRRKSKRPNNSNCLPHNDLRTLPDSKKRQNEIANPGNNSKKHSRLSTPNPHPGSRERVWVKC
jgi:hypothetical protein